jgi:methylenetetrahydrofolate dehydrogenase (NADP+)/methenyltetrahydrofolate cyclohydrolase
VTRIISGKDIRVQKIAALRERMARLADAGRVPSLLSIQVGRDENSRVYLQAQKRIAEQLGIRYGIRFFEAAISAETLVYNIRKINDDPDIDAVILQTPLPQHLKYREMVRLLDPAKDAEGTHPFNLGCLALNSDVPAPPTARAVMDILDFSGCDLYGKKVTIVGSSDIVGKPLAMMLLNRMATVSVTHVATSEKGQLPEYVAAADILIVAVGRSRLIKGEWVKEGAVVVDVGINCVDGVITGDVEFEVAAARASAITPVPGGVGPVTAVALMENVVNLVEHRL